MTTSNCESTIGVEDLRYGSDWMWQTVDVRSATEFAAGHVPGAVNIPMDEIESRVDDLRKDFRTILVCQSGKRASMTQALLAEQRDDLCVLRGGTEAWERAGFPLVRSTRMRWALERQVRLGAGLLVVTGLILGIVAGHAWFWLAGFAGCGLIVAGTTNYCAMANLLALLPWNRRGSRPGRATRTADENV